MKKITKLSERVQKIKAISDNLSNDFKALQDVDNAVASARAELADKVRAVTEHVSLDHIRRQLEHIYKESKDALRELTDMGAYEEDPVEIEAEPGE